MHPAIRSACSRLGWFTFAIALLYAGNVLAAPGISIMKPAAGAVFNSGQMINVTVRVTSPGSFRSYALIGNHRLGAAAPLNASGTPSFALTIPAEQQPGPYFLTVIGYGPEGTVVAQDDVQIQIESPAALLNLIAPANTLTFEAIGEQLPLQIVSGAPGGTPLDVTHSSHLAFTSSNPAVGMVDSNAMVTATAPGQAAINVQLDSGGSLSVPIRVLPVALTPSATSLSLANETMGVAGSKTPLTFKNTANYPLRVLSVASSPDFAESDNCIATSPLAVGGTCTVNLVFRPVAQGARPGFLSIADSAVVAPTQVTLNGVGTASKNVRAAALPNALNFGAVAPGHSKSATIRIFNFGTGMLNGYVPPLAGSFRIVKGAGFFSVGLGRAAEITLAYSPPTNAVAAQHPIFSILEIATSDPAAPSIPINLNAAVAAPGRPPIPPL